MMVPRLSLLLALGVSALVSASPLTNDTGIDDSADDVADFMPNSTETGGEAYSHGFRLYAHATDKNSPLAATVHGMYLNGYHYGAGINTGVLHALDARNPGTVFYLNQRPGHPASILTDSGEFPYALTVPPQAAPGEKYVLISVGNAGTPAAISANYVHIGQKGHGTFIACRRRLPQYKNTPLMVLQYAYGGHGVVPYDCVPIRLGVKCAHLSNGPVTHQHAQRVACNALSIV